MSDLLINKPHWLSKDLHSPIKTDRGIDRDSDFLEPLQPEKHNKHFKPDRHCPIFGENLFVPLKLIVKM